MTCNYYIRKIDRNIDRKDIYGSFIDEYVSGRRFHPFKEYELRDHYKQKTKFLYNNSSISTYILRTKNKDEYVGFISINNEEQNDDLKILSPDHIYIVKKYRKTKALAFIGNYILNIKFKYYKIKVESNVVSGFGKLLYNIESNFNIYILNAGTRERIEKICRGG